MAMAVACWAALSPVRAWAETVITGPARIIDGDTLDILDQVYRLHGIDAPERKQMCRTSGGEPWPCGREAADELGSHIAGRDVTCFSEKRGRYGRWIAVCYAYGQDLGAWMVRHGWALAYHEYSKDYIPQEKAAKAERLGLWSGDFIPPWAWRKQKGEPRRTQRPRRPWRF